LFEPDFLLVTPWHGLREYPRYIKAMRIRVEKLSNGGIPKDRKLNDPIKELASEYAELLREGRDKAQLDSVRWMLEELRVSTFAQNLGTRQSVSIKRVSEALSRFR
jgi:ATP-dependent helicase HrpA